MKQWLGRGRLIWMVEKPARRRWDRIVHVHGGRWKIIREGAIPVRRSKGAEVEKKKNQGFSVCDGRAIFRSVGGSNYSANRASRLPSLSWWGLVS